MTIPTKTEHELIDVILLYNSVDRKEVEEVYWELRRRGLNAWIDTQSIPPGKEYQAEFGKALGFTKSAAVFYGKRGVGKWERKELQAAVQEFIDDSNRTIIPVFLPGAERAGGDGDSSKPKVQDVESIFIKLRKNVELQCKWGIGDPEAYDVLEWGITGKDPREDRGVYQIQVRVPKAERSCFIAFPPDGPAELYETICRVLTAVGMKCSPFSAPSEMGTPVELAEAIRSSELVIAVCSPDPMSKGPAPSTMFLLGQAMALGKPVLRITSDASSVPPVVATTPMVEYTEKDLDDGESLERVLVERIQHVVRGLRHPYLTEPRRQDISVAYADMLRIPVSAWDRFEAILSFGFTVYRRFHVVAKHVHKLHRDIRECLRSTSDISEPMVMERNWRLFEQAYEEFTSSDQPIRREFVTDDDRPADSRVPEAFHYLRDHMADPLRKTAVKTAAYFGQVLKAIRRYFLHLELVPPLVEQAASASPQLADPSQRDLYEEHVGNLDMYLDRIAKEVQVIEMQTRATMTGLLVFFGSKGGDIQ